MTRDLVTLNNTLSIFTQSAFTFCRTHTKFRNHGISPTGKYGSAKVLTMLFHSILQADLDTFALPNFLGLFRIKNTPAIALLFLSFSLTNLKINKNILNIISVIIIIIILINKKMFLFDFCFPNKTVKCF